MKIIDFLRKLLEVLWSVPTRLFGSRTSACSSIIRVPSHKSMRWS